MKVALIGAGRIGRLHGRLLAELPGVDAVIVSDVDLSAARSLAAAIGGEAADDARAAMESADAVVVAAATNAHADLVRTAVGLRRPTFVEKPLAHGLDETLELARFVEDSGVPFQVGFQRRFDAGCVEAHRLVSSGEIGTVYALRLIAHDADPPPEAYIPTSGGLFRDSSVHDFDELRFITGLEVDEVYAVGGVRGFEVFARYGDVDTAAAILRLTDGTIATLSQTRHNPLGYDVRVEIVGSRDAVAVGLGSRTPIRSLEADGPTFDTGWESFLTRFEPAYRAELAAFVRLVRGEIASPCTARDGVEALRVAEAATLSLADHRPVRVSEIPG